MADSLSLLYRRPANDPIQPFVPFSEKFANMLEGTGYGNTVDGALTGGSATVTYYVSGRYAYEDGPFTRGPFDGNAKDVSRRYQGTLNLGLFPRDNVTMNFHTFYSDSHLDTPVGTNSINSPYALTMYAKPERAYCLDDSLKVSFQNIVGRLQCGPKGGNPLGNTFNATVREALQNEAYQDATHFNAALTTSFVPLPELTFDATVGVDNTDTRNISFLPFGNAVDKFTTNAPDGSRGLTITTIQNLTFDLKGSWTRQLNAHLNSAFIVGGQGFITDTKSQGGTNRNFPGPGLEVIGAGNQPSITETLLKVVNAGYFGQEQVGINNWVFLTGGLRYDYNSAFGQSAGGVLYPKASISIVPSDRRGWTSTTLSALRFRAAIGKSGRQPGAFDKFTTYAALPSQFGGGLVPSNLGNPDLKPEVSTETEGGAELGLFSNRVSLTGTYWNRVVDDALVSKQFPISGGFTQTQLANVGQLKAHGTEIGVTAYVINRPAVALDVFANGAYLWQKITKLGGSQPLKAGGSYVRYRNFIKEGYAPGTLFGAKIATACGAYPSGQAAKLQSRHLCLAPGQLPFDLNGDSIPDTEAQMLARLGAPIDPGNLKPLRADDDCGRDMSDPRYKGCGDFLDHYLGKPTPDWQGGFGGNLRLFKSWRMTTLFEYKAGNYVVTNLTDAFRNSSSSIGRNTMAAAQTEATLLNPASSPEQRLRAAKDWLHLVALSPYDGVNQNSNGDFIRWRELSLTYDAPASLASRVRASSMALTFGVRNLALWTKYNGTDPEISVQGITNAGGVDANFLDAVDSFGLPLARRFTFSIRLGF